MKYIALASSSNARLTAQTEGGWHQEAVPRNGSIYRGYAGFHAEVPAQPSFDRSFESERAAAEAEERRTGWSTMIANGTFAT